MDSNLKELIFLAKEKRICALSKTQEIKYNKLVAEISQIIEEERNPITLSALQMRFYDGLQWDKIGDNLGFIQSDAIRKACYRSYEKIKKRKEQRNKMKITTIKELETITEPFKEYEIKISSLDTPIEEIQSLAKIMIDPEKKQILFIGDYETADDLRNEMREERRKQVMKELREETERELKEYE